MTIIHMEQDEPALCLPEDANALVIQHYDTLKNLARSKRRRSNPDHTLLTTDLLHESWLKLRGKDVWRDEAHFMRTAAMAMRQVLIDYARTKSTQKRGSDAIHQNYDDISEILPEFKETPEQILQIGDLLKRLAEVNPKYLDVLDMRYFGGFTEVETAKVMGVTSRTVRRHWTTTKTWLAAEMAIV